MRLRQHGWVRGATRAVSPPAVPSLGRGELHEELSVLGVRRVENSRAGLENKALK